MGWLSSLISAINFLHRMRNGEYQEQGVSSSEIQEELLESAKMKQTNKTNKKKNKTFIIE